MRIKKFSMMLLIALSTAALLNGCGTSSKQGTVAGAGYGTVAKVDETACRVCHATSVDKAGQNIIQKYLASPHNRADVGCQGCHGGGAQHNGVGPLPYMAANAAESCKECHDGATITTGTTVGNTGKTTAKATYTVNFGSEATATRHTAFFAAAGGSNKCGACHGAHNPLGDFVGSAGVDCLTCHDIAQDRTKYGNYVNDNNGVRAITAEFAKWSHHVTGVAIKSAHCAACHLEGTVKDGVVVVDKTKHMADAKTHLRHADTDVDMLWDPAAPNHSTMDAFCMSCHDANGATSPGSIAIQAVINTKGYNATGKTASASNPFGDTISNRYDKMQRPAVVDVDSQFNTANVSHHAVKGPKYTGRTRAAGDRQIASPSTFAANSSATLWGKRSTIYDSVNALSGVEETTNKAFNALYVPLSNAGGEVAPRTGSQDLGDDSTLHCGDCHTVGQWKPGVATNAAGVLNTVAIGAHGSNNEYMLRNSIGTDERHTQDAYEKNTALNTPNPGPAGTITLKNPTAPFLVCFNCHSYSRYGSVYNATGTTGPHAGEYDASGRCNGVGNTIPFNGYTTGAATDGTQFKSRFDGPRSKFGTTPAFAPGFPLDFTKAPGGVQSATGLYTGEQDPDFGNIFGIQCANCHNSGVENGYGGIHGSTINTYVDGMGNTQKMRRFLPGLGNTKYVPGTLGGITGGTTAGPVTNTRNSAGKQSYTYTTGGVSNDTNWEQIRSKLRFVDGVSGAQEVEFQGAGCYTLTENTGAATSGQHGLSVDGGKTTPEAFGTWGGCDDHGAVQGAGDHEAYKRINRPVTY